MSNSDLPSKDNFRVATTLTTNYASKSASLPSAESSRGVNSAWTSTNPNQQKTKGPEFKSLQIEPLLNKAAPNFQSITTKQRHVDISSKIGQQASTPTYLSAMDFSTVSPLIHTNSKAMGEMEQRNKNGISNKKLPGVPLYMLDTNFVVKPGFEEFSKNLEELLEKYQVDFDYDMINAKWNCFSYSEECRELSFRIYLYQEGKNILVEFQKRKGCTQHFYQLFYAIYDDCSKESLVSITESFSPLLNNKRSKQQLPSTIVGKIPKAMSSPSLSNFRKKFCGTTSTNLFANEKEKAPEVDPDELIEKASVEYVDMKRQQVQQIALLGLRNEVKPNQELVNMLWGFIAQKSQGDYEVQLCSMAALKAFSKNYPDLVRNMNGEAKLKEIVKNKFELVDNTLQIKRNAVLTLLNLNVDLAFFKSLKSGMKDKKLEKVISKALKNFAQENKKL